MAKQKVHHEMVAYSGELTDVLRDVLRDNLSPEAVVGIAAYIGSVGLIKKASVQKEVAWFHDFLLKMVGVEEYNRMIEEIGL